MPVTKIAAYLWICSRWLRSATRFGEQAGTPYSRCGRTKVPYRGMKADFERSWKERLIMTIMIFAASVHWAEGENILPVRTPRSLTNLDTGMGVPDICGDYLLNHFSPFVANRPYRPASHAQLCDCSATPATTCPSYHSHAHVYNSVTVSLYTLPPSSYMSVCVFKNSHPSNYASVLPSWRTFQLTTTLWCCSSAVRWRNPHSLCLVFSSSQLSLRGYPPILPLLLLLQL